MNKNNTKKPSEEWEKKLRWFLNDFLMDVDNGAEIEAETANAIVSVHLQKFNNLFREAIQATREETKIEGATELFQLIDKKFESFKISEAVGEALNEYRDSLAQKKGIRR